VTVLDTAVFDSTTVVWHPFSMEPLWNLYKTKHTGRN